MRHSSVTENSPSDEYIKGKFTGITDDFSGDFIGRVVCVLSTPAKSGIRKSRNFSQDVDFDIAILRRGVLKKRAPSSISASGKPTFVYEPLPDDKAPLTYTLYKVVGDALAIIDDIEGNTRFESQESALYCGYAGDVFI